MKKTFILAVSALLLFISSVAVAQSSAGSFSLTHDSLTVTVPNSGASPVNFFNPIVVPSGSVTLQWKVVYTNFPSDWLSVGATGVCDNHLCYGNVPITTGTTQTSEPYTVSGTNDFHVQIIPDSFVTNGCYKIKVKLWNQANPNDSTLTTFTLCRYPLGVPVVKSAEPVIYPNPAASELNVVFDAGADVSHISVYNLIGKVVSVYRVNGNSANLNLENIPSGIYFLRLTNSSGQVVSTKRFTKQ